MASLISYSLITALPVFVLGSCSGTGSGKTDKPNILVILVDDMGYSDIGCYGGEINTPNLDKLAENGIRFTQFYNAARCCPTRASLLTGLYPHQAGMGAMTRNPETSPPGPYQGYLNDRCVTIAEVLKEAGYYSAISGKWHVGDTRPHWPTDRGFDNFFGLIGGAANFFDINRGRHPDRETLHLVDTVRYVQPEDFYMTDAITDHALGFIQEATKRKQPLFLYLSYTAPHWPLHARQEDIDKYRGKYLKGWDVLAAERVDKMVSLGLIEKPSLAIPRDSEVPEWDSLSEEQKDRLDLLMAIYAAQIDRMDQGIGRVLTRLKELDELNNTLILFLSDNGACDEYDMLGTDFWGNFWDGTAIPGSGDSFASYGRAWANLSNVPLRLYKKNAHEGGIATPCIAHWPEGIKNPGRITGETGHIIDIMPTLCQLAGISYPEVYNNRPITPSPGLSLLPVLLNETMPERPHLFWEHINNKAIRNGDWKLVAEAGKDWELFNMAADRYELNNMAKEFPDKVQAMEDEYMTWAKAIGVR
jgi:arylsulfatase A-like enzyme